MGIDVNYIILVRIHLLMVAKMPHFYTYCGLLILVDRTNRANTDDMNRQSISMDVPRLLL